MRSHEQRSYLRVQITLEVRVAGPVGVAYGKLRDISKGNASFYLNEEVGRPGDMLDLFVPFSDRDEIAIMGKLTRVETTPRGNLHAVIFTLVEPALRQTLDRFLEHTLALRGSETRKHPRVAFQTPIVYRDPAEHPAILETIALGGLGMTSDEPVNPPCGIEVEIPWPKTDRPPPPPLRLAGDAVSSLPLVEQGRVKFRIGVQFKQISPELKKTLDLYIRAVLSITRP